MDAWSGKIQLLRSEFADSFLYLPLLILGFSFLYGLLTSNIGLLYLFLGQLAIVPSLGWLMNETKPFLNANNGLFTLASIALVFGIIGGGTLHFTKDMPVGQAAWSWYAVPFILAFVKGLAGFTELSILDIINPAVWAGVTKMASSSAICSIVPNVENPWTSPSVWTLHITFFSGYILANAIALYNQPAPKVDDSSIPSDIQGEKYASALKEQQGKVSTRVGNRKTIAAAVGSIISIVCLVLLWFRFNKTPCESDWRLQIFPIITSIFVGYMTFFLASDCGVRPVDVLGLVQGMIQPVAPTVCVATTS
jgi:hypothetical protein